MDLDEKDASLYLLDIGVQNHMISKFELRHATRKALKCPQKIIKCKLNINENILKVTPEDFSKLIMEKWQNRKVLTVIEDFDEDKIPLIDILDEDGISISRKLNLIFSSSSCK